MSTLEKCLKIAKAKFCAFHSCTNNSYRCSDLQFFPFPKACTRVAFDIKLNNKHIRGCSKCKRCQRWSIGCRISPDLGFKAHRLYICGNHFIHEHPSNKYPDPMSVEMINRIRKLEIVQKLKKKNQKSPKKVSKPTTNLSVINSKLASLHDIRDILSATTAVLDEVYSRVLEEGRRCQQAINRKNASKQLNNKNEEKEMLDKLELLEVTVAELDHKLTTSSVITAEDTAVFNETNLSQATRLKEKNELLMKKKLDLKNKIEAKTNILKAEENALQNILCNDSSTIILIVEDDYK